MKQIPEGSGFVVALLISIPFWIVVALSIYLGLTMQELDARLEPQHDECAVIRQAIMTYDSCRRTNCLFGLTDNDITRFYQEQDRWIALKCDATLIEGHGYTP